MISRQEATLTVDLSPPVHVLVWLSGDSIAKPRLGETRNGQDVTTGRWLFRNLRPGSYSITLDPDYDDWAAHCIGHTNVMLASGDNSVVLVVPTNQIEATVSFPGSPPDFPAEISMLPLRVEQLGPKGADPIYRQWLWVRKTEPHKGKLDQCGEGRYRITAFDYRIDSSGRRPDVFRADVVVNRQTLESGKMTIEMIKMD